MSAKKAAAVATASASAAAPAAAPAKSSKPKKSSPEDMPTSQQTKLEKMTREKFHKSVSLTTQGSNSMNVAVCDFIAQLTQKADAVRKRSGRTKLDAQHIYGALQTHYPALLCGKWPKDAQIMQYADKRVTLLGQHLRKKQDQRMEIEGAGGAAGEQEDDEEDEALPEESDEEGEEADQHEEGTVDEEELEDAGAAAADETA